MLRRPCCIVLFFAASVQTTLHSSKHGKGHTNGSGSEKYFHLGISNILRGRILSDLIDYPSTTGFAAAAPNTPGIPEDCTMWSYSNSTHVWSLSCSRTCLQKPGMDRGAIFTGRGRWGGARPKINAGAGRGEAEKGSESAGQGKYCVYQLIEIICYIHQRKF